MPAPSRMFMSGGYGGRRTVDAAISEAARSRAEAPARTDYYITAGDGDCIFSLWIAAETEQKARAEFRKMHPHGRIFELSR